MDDSVPELGPAPRYAVLCRGYALRIRCFSFGLSLLVATPSCSGQEGAAPSDFDATLGTASEAASGANIVTDVGAGDEGGGPTLEQADYAGSPEGEGEGEGEEDDDFADADADSDASFDDDTDEEAHYADDEADDAEIDAQAERAWRDEVGPDVFEAQGVVDEASDVSDAAGVSAEAIDSVAREAEARGVDELSAAARPIEQSTAEARSVDDFTAEAQAVDELSAADLPVEARGGDPEDEGGVVDADEISVDDVPRRVWRRDRAGPRFFDNVDHRHKPRLLACVGASAYFAALVRRYDVVGRCTFEEDKHARRVHGQATRAYCEEPSFSGCRYQAGIERYFYGYTRVLLRPRRDASAKKTRARRERTEARFREFAGEETS